MSSAPTPAPHTPVNFLRAGGMANFSAACAKLLMKAGYDPAAFGSFAHVQAMTERAKQRAAHYKLLKSQGNPTADDFRPTDAEVALAECEPQMLAYDAASPPKHPPEQMPAMAVRGPSTVPGTEAAEVQRAVANGGDPGAVIEQQAAARAAEKPKLTSNGRKPKSTKAELAKEDATRAQVDESIGGQQRAGGNQGPPPTRSKGKSTAKIQGQTVGECIDNFVKQSLADLDAKASNSAKAGEGAAAGGTSGGETEGDKGHQVVRRDARPGETSEATGAPVVGAKTVVEHKVDGKVVAKYYVDEHGRTIRAEGLLAPPDKYKKEGVGGMNMEGTGYESGRDHRGHLIPERSAAHQGSVNVEENVIAEHGRKSNLSEKKKWENEAFRQADDKPGSWSTHEPQYPPHTPPDPPNPRPTAVNHNMYDSKGKPIPGMDQSIPNPEDSQK